MTDLKGRAHDVFNLKPGKHVLFIWHNERLKRGKVLQMHYLGDCITNIDIETCLAVYTVPPSKIYKIYD